MDYIKGGEVFSERQVRASLPHVSLPELLLPEHVAEFGFVAYVAPPPTLTAAQEAARLQAEIVSRVQFRLDAFAASRGYDSIHSLASYAGDPDPAFSAEGSYGRLVRSQTWRLLYQILADVQSGLRPIPAGYEDIEPELPVLAWPV